MSGLVLTVLQILAQQRGKTVVDASYIEAVVHVPEILHSNITTEKVRSPHADVLCLGFSAALDDSFVVFGRTPAELAEAHRTVKCALEEAFASVVTEMLIVLQERMHNGMTSKGAALASCFLQAWFPALRRTSDVWSGTVQRTLGDCLKLTQTVFGVPATLDQARYYAVVGVVNELSSGRVGQVVRALRFYATVTDARNAEALETYYGEEMWYSLLVLERVLAASAAVRNAAAVEGNDTEDTEEAKVEETPAMHNVLQRVVQAIRGYAVALGDARILWRDTYGQCHSTPCLTLFTW
ncbi:hypothetical protein TraAM80_06358 [Trypanosoma rangeli]|uniref:Uncharacterized protein n=1 Tax=Trypanosoma rangeli TaxID=5698 RepID=A0A3S5IQU6_TRYRA|nr:uncharacterized protein TraAM80_06358 [Trypanosoma rangeli]RNF02452.1 hypothetical protein TraAM80_06358 [Trypanosoma rangeli]|eukprot:RNF02452.1 hypothetical protein TraAM80_06358 [Trypanosoma rangeli]